MVALTKGEMEYAECDYKCGECIAKWLNEEVE
jgi:hypothetical protein